MEKSIQYRRPCNRKTTDDLRSKRKSYMPVVVNCCSSHTRRLRKRHTVDLTSKVRHKVPESTRLHSARSLAAILGAVDTVTMESKLCTTAGTSSSTAASSKHCIRACTHEIIKIEACVYPCEYIWYLGGIQHGALFSGVERQVC